MKNTLSAIILVSSLLLGGCALSTPPETMDAGGKEPPARREEPQKNTKLNLNGRGLEKIPADVFDRTDLEELDVSDNRLTGAIQAEIGRLVNLKILKAGDNLMTGVPAEIGRLQKLEILDLSDNRLTGLPHELGNLKNLKILEISGNDYSEYDLDIIKRNLPDSVNIVK